MTGSLGNRKRRLAEGLIPGAIMTALLGLGMGCATDESGILIYQNQVPATGCVVSATQSASFFSRGIIDTQATTGYVFNPLIGPTDTSTNDSAKIVEITSADVELESDFLTEDEIAGLRDAGAWEFNQPLSGSLLPGGFASFSFIAVPMAVLDTMDAVLEDGAVAPMTVNVTMHGKFVNGNGVSSNKFAYPLEVCKNCLKRDLGMCTSVSEDATNISPGGLCNPLQDAPLDCCTLLSGDERCPASFEELPEPDPVP